MEVIKVSVVYIDEAGVLFDELLTVPAEWTIGTVIQHSSFCVCYPHLNLNTLNVGVYSLRKTLSDKLHDQDRIEIYRPLLIDPKDRRRKIVDQKRSPKKWRQARSIKDVKDREEQ